MDGDSLWFSADIFGYPETTLVRIDHSGYALSHDGQHLASIDEGAGGNVLRRFDVTTGATVSVTPFGVPGWVSAIAFVPAP